MKYDPSPEVQQWEADLKKAVRMAELIKEGKNVWEEFPEFHPDSPKIFYDGYGGAYKEDPILPKVRRPIKKPKPTPTYGGSNKTQRQRESEIKVTHKIIDELEGNPMGGPSAKTLKKKIEKVEKKRSLKTKKLVCSSCGGSLPQRIGYGAGGYCVNCQLTRLSKINNPLCTLCALTREGTHDTRGSAGASGSYGHPTDKCTRCDRITDGNHGAVCKFCWDQISTEVVNCTRCGRPREGNYGAICNSCHTKQYLSADKIGVGTISADKMYLTDVRSALGAGVIRDNDQYHGTVAKYQCGCECAKCRIAFQAAAAELKRSKIAQMIETTPMGSSDKSYTAGYDIDHVKPWGGPTVVNHADNPSGILRTSSALTEDDVRWLTKDWNLHSKVAVLTDGMDYKPIITSEQVRHDLAVQDTKIRQAYGISPHIIGTNSIREMNR